MYQLLLEGVIKIDENLIIPGYQIRRKEREAEKKAERQRKFSIIRVNSFISMLLARSFKLLMSLTESSFAN